MNSPEAMVRYQNDGGPVEDIDTAILSCQWIRTCAGLEYFTELKTLTLSSNLLTDVSQLAGLRHLRHLELDQNQLVDISPLARLPLTFLHLAQNRIRDLSPLSSMRRLQWLSLAENAVEDLGPLRGLGSLVQLYVQRNAIQDPGQLLCIPQDSLEYLCLCDYAGRANPLCSAAFYRLKMIRLFPGLKHLDFHREKLPVSKAERTAAANVPWTPRLWAGC